MSFSEIRLNRVNLLIKFISERGKKFFVHNGVVSEFIVKNEALYFYDAYDYCKQLLTRAGHDRILWTLADYGVKVETLLNALTQYIKIGKLCTVKNFQYLNDTDPWFYGDDMKIVVDKAIVIGICERKLSQELTGKNESIR